MTSMIQIQEAIIQHIANDRNPMNIGAGFGYYRDHYRAQISMLGFNRAQAEAAVQDAVDMAALEGAAA